MKRMIVIAFVLALASCSDPTPTSSRPQGLMAASPLAIGGEACNNPETWGAAADDDRDDRAATQSAINAACMNHKPVCLPLGKLSIERNLTASGANAIPSLTIPDGCNDLEITGVGDGSVLEMSGSGMRPGSWGPGDWNLLVIIGDGAHLSDFRIDAADRFNTGEQTHLVQLQDGASGTVVERVTANLPILIPPQGAVKCIPDASEPDFATRICHVDGSGDRLCKDLAGNPKCIPPGAGTAAIWPVSGWYTGGDCFRLLGADNPANGNVTPIERTTFRDVVGIDCDRSCWGVQRAVYDTLLDNSSCLKVGDQAIDQEPTGVGTIRRFVVRGGTYNGKITLTGNGASLDGWASNVLDSVTVNGTIFAYQAADTELRNLVVNATNEAAVGVIKDGEGFKIIGGRYTRSGTNGGPVLSFSAHAGRWPTDVYIGGDARVTQLGDGPVVKGDPVVGLTIDGAILECKGPSANTYAGVLATSVGATAGKIKVRGADVRGNCKYGVQVQGGSAGAGAISVVGNLLEAATAGVRIDGGTPTVRPVIGLNTITIGTATVSPATVQYTGTGINSP